MLACGLLRVKHQFQAQLKSTRRMHTFFFSLASYALPGTRKRQDLPALCFNTRHRYGRQLCAKWMTRYDCNITPLILRYNLPAYREASHPVSNAVAPLLHAHGSHEKEATLYSDAFDYVAPASLDEALALLGEHGANAKLLAGGQSLIPLLKLRQARSPLLINIRVGDELRIGALSRHTDLASSPC